MFNFIEKNDTRIRNDVKDELLYDPSVNSSKITVTSNDGIVTLRGSVPHFYEKSTAEKAALRVGGVLGIADELEVNMDAAFAKSDGDIALAAHDALQWAYQVPVGIQVTVDRAWITLRGEVQWDYQRNAAKDAVSDLMGVRGFTNGITLRSNVKAADVKKSVEDALKRAAETEGQNISVSVDGDRVTLTGNVKSLSELDEARVAAWNAPGVTAVNNNLQVIH